MEKNTQFGLGGTFLAMLIMTIFSNYVSFVWKYFIGVVFFIIMGGICSLLYAHKIHFLLLAGPEPEKQVNWNENLEQTGNKKDGCPQVQEQKSNFL